MGDTAVKYVSTRGKSPAVGFEDVLLAGLAPDGGLYVPAAWPKLSAAEIRALRGLDYAGLAARVMAPYLGSAFGDDDFAAIVAESYASFRHKAVAPLKQLDSNLWLLELFHGPTLAFKDYPLQLVGRLFDIALKRRGERLTIVGATSGDTGSAAIEACGGRESVDIFMLHPKGRVSEVQRRQMTTCRAANVHNVAIEGTFDDCQDLVKAMFSDAAFRERMRLSAVNSINWARVMAQTAYYFAAAVALGAPDRRLSFSVPTGNFGNVYAAFCARRIGLPIEGLVVGSNRNDILARFFSTGVMETRAVEPSLSPSMDIQISSNFERLLYDLYDGDGARVAGLMRAFRKDGRLGVEEPRWRRALEVFSGFRADDALTLASIAAVHAETGELIDPHTAVGVAAAKARSGDPSVPMVALATAHPAKFPDSVERATGIRPALPSHLADLMTREERMTVLPNDIEAVKDFVRGRNLVGAAP
jgi:threonine synthase